MFFLWRRFSYTSGYGSILHLAQLSFSLQLYVESPKVFIQHERPSAACCS